MAPGPLRSRRRTAALALLLAALASVPACRDGARASAGPRVLVVTIDTLRADHVGAYGGPVPTPGFDGVAAAGALFVDAATPTPSTGPAHASLWTGLHPWRHGVLDNAEPLADEIATVAAQARAAGIATAAFVSSFVLDARFGLGRGFATYRFEPGERYAWRGRDREGFWTRADVTTDAALAWLEAHRREPFLVWVHYFDPHAPYAPPPGFARPATERIPLEGKSLPPGVPSFAHLAEQIRGYRGDVAWTDAELRRLLDGLRAEGLLDTTSIVVTSDHGEGLGDHGLLEHGENLFDELVRVPLAVCGPGIPAGRRLAGPVQLEDLAPTVLELLGLPVPSGLDGVSLAAWLRGASAASPRDVVLGRRKPYRGQPDLFFARSPGRKWIGALDGPGVAYALDADPREERPLPAARPEALAQLGELAHAPAAPPALDAETRRALEALGYLEPEASRSSR